MDRVVFCIQRAIDHQSGSGGCVASQLDDPFVIAQRLAPPMLADLAKKTMLDRIPFGGARWIMANGDTDLITIH